MKYILALAILLASPAAHAGGFAELFGGLASPLEDDDYDAVIDVSPKLGVRVGAVSAGRDALGIGFEIGADWTPLSSDLDLFQNESFHRLRVLGGARLVYRATDQVDVVARFAAGIDYTRASVSSEVLGVEVELSDDSIGIAIDPSIAVQGMVGDTGVGLQLGLPVSVHGDDDDEFDISYTSWDVDLLFVITRRM